ncbi:unnamed protein product [Caenorhabditis auriculariae]|uniref:Uncharacterized protein n=1 Tax=Caenorhabditis auriculariae TaxID=2777116 RepID=A0A8S1GYU3_9PELO|nr:unnamed protein product [Caenorhabditis auriculariae]
MDDFYEKYTGLRYAAESVPTEDRLKNFFKENEVAMNDKIKQEVQKQRSEIEEHEKKIRARVQEYEERMMGMKKSTQQLNNEMKKIEQEYVNLNLISSGLSATEEIERSQSEVADLVEEAYSANRNMQELSSTSMDQIERKISLLEAAKRQVEDVGKKFESAEDDISSFRVAVESANEIKSFIALKKKEKAELLEELKSHAAKIESLRNENEQTSICVENGNTELQKHHDQSAEFRAKLSSIQCERSEPVVENPDIGRLGASLKQNTAEIEKLSAALVRNEALVLEVRSNNEETLRKGTEEVSLLNEKLREITALKEPRRRFFIKEKRAQLSERAKKKEEFLMINNEILAQHGFKECSYLEAEQDELKLKLAGLEKMEKKNEDKEKKLLSANIELQHEIEKLLESLAVFRKQAESEKSLGIATGFLKDCMDDVNSRALALQRLSTRKSVDVFEPKVTPTTLALGSGESIVHFYPDHTSTPLPATDRGDSSVRGARGGRKPRGRGRGKGKKF